MIEVINLNRFMETLKMNRTLIKFRSIILLFVISFTFSQIFSQNSGFFSNEFSSQDIIYVSAQELNETEVLSNNRFNDASKWELKVSGDPNGVDGIINEGQAKYQIFGEKRTFADLYGTPNSSTSPGWKICNNSDFLLPDDVAVNASGCYVYHFLDESEGPDSIGQVHNFPSVHFRKNVSLPVDMSEFNITSASLDFIFNASVDANVDTPTDTVDQGAIFDSATFYVEIADIQINYPFRVAENKTRSLGRDGDPRWLTINDTLIEDFNEKDLIDALNLALENDPDHSNFTIIIGIDIYCEDNFASGGGDRDKWNALIINNCNLTFTYEKKIEKFTSISWNQIGDDISGRNIKIKEATFEFDYKIDKPWPTLLSPFSEIRIIINDDIIPETVRISSAKNSFDEAKEDGFEVTDFIEKGEDTVVSIEAFIANTFGFDRNITISIDNVYLYIKYITIEPETDWTPLVMVLVGGIIALASFFTLYEKHFKHPPMIRKIRKLKKIIKKGKKKKS